MAVLSTQILGYLKSQGGGAYSWGFVSGKSQTIYPWSSWKREPNAVPKVWFHDTFDANGKAYDPKEIAYIQNVTGKRPRARGALAMRQDRLHGEPEGAERANP